MHGADDFLNGGFSTDDVIDGGDRRRTNSSAERERRFDAPAATATIQLNGNAGPDTLDGGDGNDTPQRRRQRRFNSTAAAGNDNLRGEAPERTRSTAATATTHSTDGEGNSDSHQRQTVAMIRLLGGAGNGFDVRRRRQRHAAKANAGNDTVIGGLGADLLQGDSGQRPDPKRQSPRSRSTTSRSTCSKATAARRTAIFTVTLSQASSGAETTVDFAIVRRHSHRRSAITPSVKQAHWTFDAGVTTHDDHRLGTLATHWTSSLTKIYFVNLSNPTGRHDRR